MSLLTGKSPPPRPPFGVSAKDLDPGVQDTHEHAKTAMEESIRAKEAAQDAVQWDRGIIQNVETAEDAWKGALYAKKVDEKIKKADEELQALFNVPDEATRKTLKLPAVAPLQLVKDRMDKFIGKVSKLIQPGTEIIPAPEQTDRSIAKMNKFIDKVSKLIQPGTEIIPAPK